MEPLAVRLAHIDRRIIFVLVALVCLLPLVLGFSMPSIVSPPAQALYDAVEKTPPDKLVVLSTSCDLGTKAEVVLMVNTPPAGSLAMWIAFVGQPRGVPMGFACTAVMAPEAYPYLDSGQIVGMMAGMAGAAQYFQLLGRKGFLPLAMTSQS